MKKASYYIFAALIACFWMVCHPAKADWINLSGAQNAPNIAEIHIDDDHVRIELEIFVNDLVTFDRLMPDEFFVGTKIKRAALEERMQQFSDAVIARQVLRNFNSKRTGDISLVYEPH